MSADSPNPGTIKLARIAASTPDGRALTQQQAGAVVGLTARAWRQYEAGVRSMPRGLYELFCIKAIAKKYP